MLWVRVEAPCRLFVGLQCSECNADACSLPYISVCLPKHTHCKGQTLTTPLHQIILGGCNSKEIVAGVLGITRFNQTKAKKIESNKPSRGSVRQVTITPK